MRATVRITWLLLSLSLLFHSICSSDVDDGATSVSKNAAAATPATTAVPANGTTPGIIITEATTVNKTGAPAIDDAGETNKPTQAPTPKQTTAVVTATTPPKSTFKPVPDQPQAQTVTDNPVPPPTTVSVATGVTPTVKDDASPAAATSSLPNIITQASTADSSGSLVTSPKVTIIGTSEASLTSKTSGTGPPISLPENTNNEGTTKIPEISTDGPTAGQQATTLTTITSPEASKGVEGTEKVTVTVTVTSQEQTASRAPEPTGTIGTASTPSILTKAGPPAAETLGTQAGTTPPQTTPTPDLTTTTTTTITTLTAAQSKTFLYSLNTGHEREEEKDLVEVCRRLMANLQDGNCSLTWRHRNGKIQFDCVEINGKVTTSLATQYYEEITMKPTDNKTLIAILASCGALLIMIVILAVCASHHRKPYSETQQHLTEELHTVENGYHDNPTLEVMEVQPEMQEKKMALNGEFNDSWMIPIDNLLKEDIPDEEDTHL